MDRTPPRALKSLIVALLIAVVIISIIVAIISVGIGYLPSWGLFILIATFIALVIVRIYAMVGYGYPRYDSSRLFMKNEESKEKKK